MIIHLLMTGSTFYEKIPIKVTVVSLFLFLSFLISSSLLFIQYSYSKDLIRKALEDQLQVLISKLENSIDHMNSSKSEIVKISSSFLIGKDVDDLVQNRDFYLEIFSSVLKANKNIYAVYVGFENDSFFELINLNIDPTLRPRYKAKLSDHWLYIEIVNGTKKEILLDDSMQVSGLKSLKSDYLVTQRPWYKASLASSGVATTRPYDFSNIDAKGITYAKKIPNEKSVFGLDLLINHLNDTLRDNNGNLFKNSYIISKSGQVIAKSSDESNDGVLNELISIIKTQNPSKKILKESIINQTRYVYSIIPFRESFVCSYGEIDIIKAPYIKKINISTLLIGIILLLILPLIFYFSSIIVRPILQLVGESKKVKDRKFSEVKLVDSNVLEIHTLSKALVEMSDSIYQYQTSLEQKVKERTVELRNKNKELEILSITDKLTGTFNRIKLDQSIENALLRANEFNEPFGIIIIDIDHFKKVNDTFGHQVGDAVLISFASILKESVRKTDIVGRWGGEEFIVICFGATLSNTFALAQKLKEKIEKFKFDTVGQKTASFGVASYQKKENIESIIKRADEALYKAKQEGRNRVKTIEELS